MRNRDLLASPAAVRKPVVSASGARMAFAPQTGPRSDVLVVVFLRGAADGLNIIVPHGEEAYYKLRPNLAIARPDDRRAGDSRVLDLDGFFGLHPALGALMEVWRRGHIAAVHACGAPDESRSHFKAMELMERGVSDALGPGSGWIGRHLATLENGNLSPLRAVGVGERTPVSLLGSVPAAALRSITDFHFKGAEARAAAFAHALKSLYRGAGDLEQIGEETLAILDAIQRLDPARYRPEGGAAYRETPFAQGLRQVAMLIKAQVGLEAAALDLGGWDTHFTQGAARGLMASLLTDLGDGLAAFDQDLGDRMRQVTVVVMTEFGRRARENASLGTDHGHASLMLVMNGSLDGARVLGEWPGLDADRLFGPGDLAVTTDYRDVLAEVLAKRLGNTNLGTVFPDYSPHMPGLFEG